MRTAIQLITLYSAIAAGCYTLGRVGCDKTIPRPFVSEPGPCEAGLCVYVYPHSTVLLREHQNFNDNCRIFQRGRLTLETNRNQRGWHFNGIVVSDWSVGYCESGIEILGDIHE